MDEERNRTKRGEICQGVSKLSTNQKIIGMSSHPIYSMDLREDLSTGYKDQKEGNTRSTRMVFIPINPRRIQMSDQNTTTELLKYDTEVIKQGFNNWIDKWEWTFNEEGERVKGIIQQEFNNVVEDDLNETVTIKKIESDNSLKFKFHTEFTFYITKEEKEKEDQ